MGVRKLITRQKGKVSSVKDYVNIARSLTSRRLPLAVDLPDDLTGDAMMIGAALRDWDYTGPLITKDGLDFIVNYVDGNPGIVYGYNDVSMAEWIAIKSKNIKIAYPAGGMGHKLVVPKSLELLGMEASAKWCPLCPPFPTGQTIPTRLAHKEVADTPDNIEGDMQVIPLSGGHSLSVARTVIARDIAGKCANADGGRTTYTIIIDERNTLNIPIVNLGDKDVSTKAINDIATMITDIAKELCLKHPLNGERTYALQEGRAAGCMMAGGKALLALTLRLVIHGKTSRQGAPWDRYGKDNGPTPYVSQYGGLTGGITDRLRSTPTNFPIQSASSQLLRSSQLRGAAATSYEDSRLRQAQLQSQLQSPVTEPEDLPIGPPVGSPQVDVNAQLSPDAMRQLVTAMNNLNTASAPIGGYRLYSPITRGDVEQFVESALREQYEMYHAHATIMYFGARLYSHIMACWDENPGEWDSHRIASACHTMGSYLQSTGLLEPGHLMSEEAEIAAWNNIPRLI